jgi:hypothetical protein
MAVRLLCNYACYTIVVDPYYVNYMSASIYMRKIQSVSNASILGGLRCAASAELTFDDPRHMALRNLALPSSLLVCCSGGSYSGTFLESLDTRAVISSPRHCGGRVALGGTLEYHRVVCFRPHRLQHAE